MNKKTQDIQRLLYQETLSLYERVVESYCLHGIPESHRGLPRFLQEIADHLNQDPPNISWLEKHSWGIYHIVQDSYLAETDLGKDLLDFNDKIDQFVAICKHERSA